MDFEAALLPELIDALPERERFVINALFFERLSFSEVARELGCTKRTVTRVRTSALAMLRSGLMEGADLGITNP